MIKTMKPVLFGLLCAVAATSCKKDALNENDPRPDTAENGKVTSAVEGDYYPYRDGSVYSYVDSVGGNANSSRSSISLSGDTTIDGKSFARTGASAETAKYYHSADGVTTLVSFNGAEKITTTVLKANEPVGTVWSDKFSNGGIPTSYDWKIVEKGLSRTVLGTTYQNVIQVHLNGTAEMPGQGKIVFANADYFYAPNVGLIENINYNAVSGEAEMHRLLQGAPKM